MRGHIQTMNETVRVRFAPSPTGLLHVGSARTALYNWAFARHHGGAFVLRIDDTDPERSTVENTEAILEAMRWLGLDWDEGPVVGGDRGPYFQTERGESYADALETLKQAGRVYPCFCTPERLAERREAAGDDWQGYDRVCRGLDESAVTERIESGEACVWRLAVADDPPDIVFDDAVRGEVRFPGTAVDDFVLVRSDGSPTYNFASVVDDATMGITHIIRGDDHLSNTPKQIVVFEALDYDVPVFAHMSLILGTDGKRLSKRHGATSVEAFRGEGFLSDALVNYIALLGWSIDDKTVIVSRDELVEHFVLSRIANNPAVFDMEKLLWMNGVYIRDMEVDRFRDVMVEELVRAGLTDASDAAARPEWYGELATLVVDRLKTLCELPRLVGFLFTDDVVVDENARSKVLQKDGAESALIAARKTLTLVEAFDADAVEEALRELPERLDMKPRVAFQSVRVAVTGTTVSPPLFESIALLGREATLSRLDAAIPLTAP
jgi:glutamyl-tRNA synthetase